jgi:hypothetical protein
VAVDQRPIDHLDVIVGAATLEQHVLAAGGDERQAGNDPVIVSSLTNLDLRQTVQSLLERGGFVLMAITVATACTKPATGNPGRGMANVFERRTGRADCRSGIEKIRTG